MSVSAVLGALCAVTEVRSWAAPKSATVAHVRGEAIFAQGYYFLIVDLFLVTASRLCKLLAPLCLSGVANGYGIGDSSLKGLRGGVLNNRPAVRDKSDCFSDAHVVTQMTAMAKLEFYRDALFCVGGLVIGIIPIIPPSFSGMGHEFQLEWPRFQIATNLTQRSRYAIGVEK